MMRFARLCLSGAVLALLLAASTGGASTAPEKKKLTMAIAGTSTQIYFLAVNVAKAHDYFKDEGLDIETVDFAGGAKALEALVGGSAEIDAGSYEHTLQMQAKGQGVQCIVLYGRSVGTVLAVSKAKAASFKSIQDLKGMRVGVSSPGFSATNIYLNLILSKNGMKSSDVDVIGVGNGPVALAAIENGKIDAISSVDPVISELTSRDSIKIIVDSRTDEGLKEAYGGEYASGCLLATTKFIKENPNTVQALSNGIVRALKFIHTSNADQIMAILPATIVGPNSALYRASIERNLNTVAADGLISEAAAANVLRVVTAADPNVAGAKIELGATYTNDFTKKALDKAK
jgi:NitT/TauT family transport system substrate-binding protein